jgi:hypothetical protein
MPAIEKFTPAAFEVKFQSLWIPSLPGWWQGELLNWKLNGLLSISSAHKA